MTRQKSQTQSRLSFLSVGGGCSSGESCLCFGSLFQRKMFVTALFLCTVLLSSFDGGMVEGGGVHLKKVVSADTPTLLNSTDLSMEQYMIVCNGTVVNFYDPINFGIHARRFPTSFVVEVGESGDVSDGGREGGSRGVLAEGTTDIKGVAVDSINRRFFLLLSRPGNPLTVCAATYNESLGCLESGDVDTDNVTYEQGAITYSSQFGVYITQQRMNNSKSNATDWLFNFDRGTVRRVGLVGGFSPLGASDVVFADRNRNLSWIGFVQSSRFQIGIYSGLSGKGNVFTFETDISSLSYQPLMDAFFVVGVNLTYVYRPFNDSVTGLLYPYVRSNRVVTLAFAAAPLNTTIWYALSTGEISVVNTTITPQDGTGYIIGTIPNINTSAIAYMPPMDTNLQPTIPRADVNEDDLTGVTAPKATFGGSTPEFTLDSLHVDNQSIAESTQPYFGPFITSFGNEIPFPTTWLKDQSKLVDRTSQSFGGFTVHRENDDDDDEGASYSYIYSSALYNRTILSFLSLYNPSSDIQVSMPSSAGSSQQQKQQNQQQQYRLSLGLVKFSIAIYTENAQIFDLQDSDVPAANATLGWSACFYNSEGLGRFDLGYDAKESDDGTLVAYTFRRLNGGQPFVLNVPTQAIVDGERFETVPHVLQAQRLDQSTNSRAMTRSAASTPTTVLELCLAWEFPFFNSSLVYDPDVGVLVSLSTSGDNSDSSGPDLLALQVVLPIVIGGALLVCCAFLVAGVIAGVIAARRRRSSVRGFISTRTISQDVAVNL
eukprot:TRINITY_DN3968_c0_g1_i1.p1 TRINITY_DN3968_c0_g1~~TRINITY_DN3968_c0_g1_i1.p1  ORF type:complete len:771 (+),score=113.85 TRINITY_DN3968_c0_g1_i1:136-2448(+)